MKFKSLGLAALSALALTAFTGTASATTFENNGVKVTTLSTLHVTGEGSILLSATGGGLANTCTESTTTMSMMTTISGASLPVVVQTWHLNKCTKETVVFDTNGSLTIENIAGTTNGTVRSIGAKMTVPSFFGALTCVTASGAGTDIGTFTGKASGSGTLDINAVLNCGFFLPSAKWEGSETVTSGPNGVTA
jgi:hypothetical protein